MGLITGYAVYDNSGNIVSMYGTLPRSISSINKKLVVSGTIKILCKDNIVLAGLVRPSNRYYAATNEESTYNATLNMLQEMATVPIDRANIVFECYTKENIYIASIPDAAIVTLNESTLLANSSGADETTSLIDSASDNIPSDIEEQRTCKKIISTAILAMMVSVIMSMAVASLIFVIITDRME